MKETLGHRYARAYLVCDKESPYFGRRMKILGKVGDKVLCYFHGYTLEFPVSSLKKDLFCCKGKNGLLK